MLRIKQHYDIAYRDIILDACLHNLAFDRQIEGSRARYMLEIIDATNDFDFYRNAILEALLNLSSDDDDYDIQQVFDLAGWLAQRGDAGARTAVFRKFDASPAFGDLAGAYEIIALDGAQGFVYVIERLVDHSQIADDRLWQQLLDHVDENEAIALANKLRTTNPNTIPVLDEIDRWRKRYHRGRKEMLRERKIELAKPYSEVKQILFSPYPGFDYAHWGERATDSDVRQAAEDLRDETEPKKLSYLLTIFYFRAFPLAPSLLFPLAHHADRLVAVRAISALRNLNVPEVHNFALENIAKQYMPGRMLSLLTSKLSQSEYWSLAEKISQQLTDREDYHSLGFNVFDVFDEYPSANALPTLLNLYEHGPCAACRYRVVDRLDTLNAIPAWMREECLYDSNLDLRDKMRSSQDQGQSPD